MATQMVPFLLEVKVINVFGIMVMKSEITTSFKNGSNDARFIPWLTTYINGLTKRLFYGKLTLIFESGKVTTLKLEETIKPDL